MLTGNRHQIMRLRYTSLSQVCHADLQRNKTQLTWLWPFVLVSIQTQSLQSNVKLIFLHSGNTQRALIEKDSCLTLDVLKMNSSVWAKCLIYTSSSEIVELFLLLMIILWFIYVTLIFGVILSQLLKSWNIIQCVLLEVFMLNNFFQNTSLFI